MSGQARRSGRVGSLSLARESEVMKMQTWMEPGRYYFRDAMEDLGLAEEDLAAERKEMERAGIIGNVPRGSYPTFDRIYERAWHLRDVEDE
jgi:hypothetical protein